TQQAGGPGRVAGQYAAGGIDGKITTERGAVVLDQLPAAADLREPDVLQPDRLVPAVRDVQLGDVDIGGRVGDARLPVRVRRAFPPGPRVDLVPAGEVSGLG